MGWRWWRYLSLGQVLRYSYTHMLTTSFVVPFFPRKFARKGPLVVLDAPDEYFEAFLFFFHLNNHDRLLTLVRPILKNPSLSYSVRFYPVFQPLCFSLRSRFNINDFQRVSHFKLFGPFSHRNVCGSWLMCLSWAMHGQPKSGCFPVVAEPSKLPSLFTQRYTHSVLSSLRILRFAFSAFDMSCASSTFSLNTCRYLGLHLLRYPLTTHLYHPDAAPPKTRGRLVSKSFNIDPPAERK